MPIIDLTPLDSEGIHRDKPGHQSKWGKLINVAFRNGSIVPRPGFKEYLGWTNEFFTGPGTEPAPAKGLAEIFNPGSATTRPGLGWAQETIRPDGSATITGTWSFSDTSLHADVDETAPDGNFVSSSDDGAQFYLTFANPVGSWTSILGVMLRVRARAAYTNGDGQVTGTIYQRNSSGGALTEIAQFTTHAFDVNETAFWYDFAFLLEKDYVSDIEWRDAALDNLQIAFEFTSGSQDSTYGFLPNSIVASSGFTDAADGGAAAVGDITLTKTTDLNQDPDGGFPSSWAADLDSGNGLVATAANSTLQVDFQHFPASTALTSVSTVTVNFRVETAAYASVGYELYYGDASTGTLIGSGEVTGGCEASEQPINVTMETEPGTAAAWTLAKIEAATWTLKTTTAGSLTVKYAILKVSATVTGGTLQIDTVSAEIIGDNGGASPRRVIMSNRSFATDNDAGNLTDVTNSVPSDDGVSIVPFDWAVLYGQVYVVDGIDATKRYPNGSTLFESLTTNNADGATKITGRAVEAFADRILYGWVTDDTNVTPERVAYSKIFDGGTHNDNSAGDFDIVDTQGGIVALKTLNESLCFCGKEKGIYVLRRTGNGRAPIIVDPIDFETKCVSQASVQRVLLANQPVIMFLGWSPTANYNVFAFDGTQVRPVGNAISKFLLEAANAKMLPYAIGGVDSITNSYVVFVSHGRALDRKFGYAMNLNTGAWTQWQLPYSIYSADQWNAVPETTIGTIDNSVQFAGQSTLVLGGQHNLPLQAHLLPYDVLTGPQDISGAEILQPGMSANDDQIPTHRNLFTSTIETGDFQFVADEEMQITSARIHLDYRDHGPVRLAIAASVDGGANWTTDSVIEIGSTGKAGERRHRFLDFDATEMAHDRSVRFRIRVLPQDANWDLPYYWEFDRIFIEYTLGAVTGA